MKNSMKFRMERRGPTWVIVDPDNVNATVAFDQAIVDATLVQATAVEGYIAAIHGLSEDIAHRIGDGNVLRCLGVGAQLVSQKPIGYVHSQGMQRVRLMENGDIERIGAR